MRGKVVELVQKSFTSKEGSVVKYLEVGVGTGKGVFKNTASLKLLDKLKAVKDSGEETELAVEKTTNGYKIVDVGGEPRAPSAGGTYQKRSYNSGGGSSSEFRQQTHPEESRRILMQNSMGHAVALSLHNSGGKPIDVTTVLNLATRITDHIIGTATTTTVAAAPAMKQDDPAIEEELSEDVVF